MNRGPSTASVLFGLASACLSFLLLTYLVAIPLAALGIICGAVALFTPFRAFALLGITLSVLALAWPLLLMIAVSS